MKPQNTLLNSFSASASVTTRSRILLAPLALGLSLTIPSQAHAEAPLSTADSKRVQEINKAIKKLNSELKQINDKATKTAATPTEQPAPKLWSGEVEFGFVDSTGNTEETTIKSGLAVKREIEKWRYTIKGSSLNTSKDSDRTAEKYFLSNRLAYQYNKHDYSFVYASYDDDRFSGFDYRATVATGYGRRLINNELMHWDLELGPGLRSSKISDETEGEDSDEVIVRGSSDFSWKFSPTASVTQGLSVETGEDNTISNAETALKVRINGSLSLKLSYNIKYTEEVPHDTKHADTETAVTLSYNF